MVSLKPEKIHACHIPTKTTQVQRGINEAQKAHLATKGPTVAVANIKSYIVTELRVAIHRDDLTRYSGVIVSNGVGNRESSLLHTGVAITESSLVNESLLTSVDS